MVRARVYLPVKPGRGRLLLADAGGGGGGGGVGGGGGGGGGAGGGGEGGGAGWLRGMCGEGTRPARDGQVWTVARPHFDAVLQGLARRFGRVGVETRSLVSEKCTRSCQRAKKIGPEDCECVCLGRHHA